NVQAKAEATHLHPNSLHEFGFRRRSDKYLVNKLLQRDFSQILDGSQHARSAIWMRIQESANLVPEMIVFLQPYSERLAKFSGTDDERSRCSFTATRAAKDIAPPPMPPTRQRTNVDHASGSHHHSRDFFVARYKNEKN